MALSIWRADKNGQTVAIKIAHVHYDARRIERFPRNLAVHACAIPALCNCWMTVYAGRCMGV